ncbi:MAG TPA: aminotransferase class I/II-fold pyridoxal phosphate-dependent enzyme, partial [Thermogutta sp.]|nr:aminotransferase class I/II-fold pyridoxal phosphate-dependent enzyme [Thermogutta sp.]
DEAYVDFAEESCLDLVRDYEHVMIARSLSKASSEVGLRFGFLIAQPHIIRELRKVKDSYNCDALAIAGATAALSDQEWLQETRRKILATRERLMRELRGLGFDVLPSQANFVWCSHPERASKEIYERLKARKVLVRYMNYPGWGDGLRITVGTDAEVDGLLNSLREIL